MANAVNATGSLVVGRATNPDGEEAALWSEATGMTGLYGYLSLLGADLSAWSWLSSAEDITPDGRFIVGYGINLSGNTEAFHIDLGPAAVPETSTLALLGIGAAGLCAWRGLHRSKAGASQGGTS